MSDDQETDSIEAIAIVGMAGRFPGARDLVELWANLRDGVDAIRDLSDDDLRESGLDPAALPPGYVRCAAILDGGDPIDSIERFDAPFFSYSPREAEILDPQSRLFLECSWEALESAGYSSDREPGWVGVFAGVSLPAYLMSNLMGNPRVASSVDPFEILLANDRDYFATRIAYKLDLRGPALNVQTACSTSLVATHLACQSLLAYQCTLAIAGGVRVGVPQKVGYVAREGGIYSPDGRCRAFDAQGRGALFGEGIGVVVLKRLSEALADGDPIHAVIRGSAFNNDGALKVGYTAPSVEGQAEVIALAQAVAGVEPGTIGYVEAHGSGTPLGDPIEVAALTRAFRAGTEERGFCALGSIKTNVGHLEAAAGVAGLIKAALALENEAIPPSLHFETPNPQIDFETGPFYVNTSLRKWPRNASPRRAGVSSFGMGGTNAHLILEEAPERPPSGPSRPWQLLPLSAKTETALERRTDDLIAWLEAHPEADLAGFADAAFTLQGGRRALPFRRVLVCRDREDALAALRSRDGRRLLGSVQENSDRPVAFLFPGLGDHYAGMAAGLYRDEPTFRAGIDRAAELLRGEGIDLLGALFPQCVATEAGAGPDLRAMLGRGAGEKPASLLDRTEIAQPAVFAVEHALATLLMEWGIQPQALAGYSLGEYTAACLAGVFSFEDALTLVARRARLISRLPAGAMLSVALGEKEAGDLAAGEVSLAAVNGPGLSVLAGPVAAIEALESHLAGRGISTRRLPTTHAFHSRMMEPVRSGLGDLLRGMSLSAPEIPYLSNVTGDWITDGQATDPAFWVRHLVEPVRFGRSLYELLSEPARVLIEVGPGQGLSSLALQLASEGVAPVVVPCLRPSYDRQDDSAFLLGALARLWLAGLRVDWAGFAVHEQRRKLRLPTYPFERQRYWIDRPGAPASPAVVTVPSAGEREGTRHHRPANLRNVYVPPRTGMEEKLASLWQSLLGVEPIGIHDSFFELGGHSLLAPQLLVHLHQAFGIDFPLAQLFESPTIAELVEAIDLLQKEGQAALAARQELVDLHAEAVLDLAIQAEAPWPGAAGPPSEVFLTGGTGFLGASLLDELLQRTGARIHCLVRAADVEEAHRRLRSSLESRAMWRPEDADRIVAIAGDLGLPRFGLSEEAFHDLAARIDAVYHCGAWVNFTYPYKILKPANVLGTVEALRLAGEVRAKPLHYVSSIAAVPEIEYGYREDTTVPEDDDTGSTSGLFGGYGESKWVSEQLCRAARSRGIPTAIYRPTVLSGDSRTGIGPTRDMVWNLIKGCIQMGVAFEGDMPLDVAPVDYVAAAIVHLSLREDSLGRLFQLPQPRVPRWQEVFDFLREAGYPLRYLGYEEWQTYTLGLLKEDTAGENALSPFAPMVAISDAYAETAKSEGRTGKLEAVLFDDRNTQAGLRGSGIACAPFDAELLTRYFESFVATGFLPPPSGITKIRRARSEPSVSGR